MARFPLVPTAPEPERAILVGVEWRDNAWPLDRSLDELERLAHTAGAQCVARLSQRLVKPYPKSFIGSGKVEELCGLVHRMDADVVIFDDDLTPSQQSYLEKAVGESVKIIDRTALILDIFGLHAQTREGRLQVQLAQLQYLLPRLRGMWSHLAKEQTRGGIGSRFGQGESQLEVDRRLIRNKIAALRRELKQVEQRRDVQSKSRIESPAFRVALAGYTNAGKSTLLNALLGHDTLATGGVRERDDQGRHTTVARVMVALPGEAGVIADAPGLRSLPLVGHERGLARAFPEIVEASRACRFGDCTHTHEPGCAVREAEDAGQIDSLRLETFQNLASSMRVSAQMLDPDVHL